MDQESAQRLYIRGTERLRYGDLQAARSALQEALTLDAGLTHAHYELGNCLRRLGLSAEAETALKTAIAQDPALFPAVFSLAFLYREMGRIEEARATLLQLCRQAPGQQEVMHQAGGLLAEMGCYADAAALYAELVVAEPLARNYQRLGQYYQKLGRYEEAAGAFAVAIEKNADSGPAYLFTAHTRRFTAQDQAQLARFEAALLQPGLSPTTHACIHFALGKMLDDMDRYDAAFSHFQQGNALRRAEHSFDPGQWHQFAASIEAVQDAQSFHGASAAATDGPAPVFVVGMLRSGTTLVERILASHPLAYGVGEQRWLAEAVTRASELTGLPYPQNLAALTDSQLAALRRGYRDRWPVQARGKSRLVDKNPINFMHAGFIARLFPEAKIVHCRRDPLDTCLSIYFQNFGDARTSYAYALGDIGSFYTGYAAIMQHWRRLLPPHMLYEMHYESLVNDQEAETRKLLDAVGLEWDPACLDFHRHLDSISTASVWQARQPMYATAVGRAEHYAKHLGPLRQALGLSAAP